MLFRIFFLLFFLSSCGSSSNFDYKKSKYYDICKKEVSASSNPFQTAEEEIMECVSSYRVGQQK